MSELLFSATQEREAEFFAWLTDRRVISETQTTKASSRSSKGFQVVPIEKIKELISDAFEKHDNTTVNRLLEVATQQQPLSKELIRKSMRVGSGEYLKLWYVKLLEKTSFSDVIVRMLIPIAKDYLAAYEKKYQKELSEKSERLGHLFSLLESWSALSPESRERAVDMGFVDVELPSEVVPNYTSDVDNIKDVLSRFILGELERSLFHPLKHKNKVYEEFKKGWSSELEENPLSKLGLEVSIDPNDTNRIVFTPNVVLSKSLTKEDQEKLFEKYGEVDVIDFITEFMSQSQKEAKYYGHMTDDELTEICIHRQVNLPPCLATVRGPHEFEVKGIASPAITEKLVQYSIRLRGLIEDLGKRIDINVYNFFVAEYKVLRELPPEKDAEIPFVFARSETLNNFLKLATKLAKDAEDFLYVKEINSYRNQILDTKKVQNFICNLVESSISRRSVVSFYVNADVWRFLPLAMEGKNWITIADTYLASKQK
ncbi:MAG: hypothetical protein NWE94_07010 [Candidatus Bathyarchaeota archaeon]|nr:hypothetical protein [Candidatus Bathyarchaeota archaeon]